MARQSLEGDQRKYTEINGIYLDREWQRQAGIFIHHNFHTELGLSSKEYITTLPKFEPQPDEYLGKFDIPILVDPRITPSRQAELIGIKFFLDRLSVSDWKDDPHGYKTPNTPYTTWLQDGKRNLRRNVQEVRNTLLTEERGATVYDGIALFALNRNVFQGHNIDLPGTSVESDLAPFLSVFDNYPAIDYEQVDKTLSGFGSATCGRNVT